MLITPSCDCNPESSTCQPCPHPLGNRLVAFNLANDVPDHLLDLNKSKTITAILPVRCVSIYVSAVSADKNIKDMKKRR
jgi:hypothetical protein